MVNIWDVARLSGVSKSTVSRVISKKGPVKEETRIKVEKAMRELDYTPSYFAQGIRTGKTRTVAFIVPDSTNLFYNEMIVGVEDVLLENGYMVLICNTNRDPAREYLYAQELLKRNVDGMIFSTYQNNVENINYFRQLSKQLPMVFMDNIYPGEKDVSMVISEGFESTRQVVQYLYKEKGCRRIAYLRMQDINVVNHRYRGYLQGLKDCDLPFSESYVYVGTHEDLYKSHIDIGMYGASIIMQQEHPPDAILGAIDTMAIGAIQYLSDNGYRVPEDVKVVGYDNVELSSLIRPTLTTIAQPIRKLGFEGAKLLLNKINVDNAINKQLVFKPEFIIRQST